MRVKMLNLIDCASLRYVVIRSKPGRIRQFPGLDTPRFKEVSGDRIFLATEKVRIGENTVPDTRRTRRYRGISGPRHVFFHSVCSRHFDSICWRIFYRRNRRRRVAIMLFKLKSFLYPPDATANRRR